MNGKNRTRIAGKMFINAGLKQSAMKLSNNGLQQNAKDITPTTAFNDPPKTKEGKPEQVIVNIQDDNSYEDQEVDNATNSTNTSSKEKKQDSNAASDFEYKDDGEFENGSHLTDTNPQDDFL